MIKAGDILEASFWLTGAEPPEAVETIKELMITEATREVGSARVLLSEWEWDTFSPEHPDVPTPPDHIHGPDVRLLTCSAQALSDAVETSKTSWIVDLDPRDLIRLRQITRTAWAKVSDQYIPDNKCDELIEQIGPVSSQKVLQETVSRSLN